MARPKPPLNIPKYKGTPEDVPIDKWLQLSDMKASEASWTHRDRVSHFSEYIEGEAFKWYLTEIFSNSLKECHIISGLTDGVPPDVELALAGLSFKTSSEWLATAQRVETSLRRVSNSEHASVNVAETVESRRIPQSWLPRTLHPERSHLDAPLR
ncbi:hypothetical protein HPB50_008840 [Hyalomma asiaticum]|uniref:Uncharacterized protein n=1 Tax=Hyalomma asiaticum TaxID=266040 RepID=A0ACB7RNM4_HYAAI|nr:hypothetical protein HPB50_008840 [Hyalomma asiaticum]